MENKEIRDKIVSAISGDGLGNFAKFALTESPFVDAIQNLTRKDEAQIHEVKISELESKLMKAEYDLAEMERFTDDLIKQKVQDERERVIDEIENKLLEYKHDDFDGGESVGLKELQTILNSLKEEK